MALELPNLPYAHDALAEAGMSKETLEFHHDLHHKAYVDNGNKLLAGTEWESKSIEEIITGTYDATAKAQNGIFNNVSQHWNHNQFWEMMGPNNHNMPSELETALVESFGSIDKFKEDFEARYLIEDYNIKYLPNIDTFMNLERSSKTRITSVSKFLVFIFLFFL